MSKRVQLKTGCCGLRMQKAEYAAQFPVVEIQHTFYQPPQIKTLEKWRAEVPPEFEFTLKAWQLITHERRSPTYKRLKKVLTEEEKDECGSFRLTDIVREAWETTAACAKALAARRVLFQCPASFTPTSINIENLRQFFTRIGRHDLQFLWEPRGEWPAQTLRTLCRELNLIHVVDPFTARTVTPEFCYFRLHGRKGWRYVYENDELEELMEMIEGAKTAYVLFNNIAMVEDAARFQSMYGHSEE